MKNNKKTPALIARGRDFIKSNRGRKQFGEMSDQMKGMKNPLLQKDFPKDAELIDLPSPLKFEMGTAPLLEVINQRRSRRKYTDEPLTLAELSFLLWCTQGIKRIFRDGYVSLRTVPSAGSRHAFETYLLIKNVSDIKPGLYRFLAVEHKLLPLVQDAPDIFQKAAAASCNQPFVASAAVTFVWTTIPYRCEWRYRELSHKVIAIDAGHVCQNLYLAAESIGAGTCAIAAYYQDEMDELLGVDGKDEFVIYLAPVGKIP
ncbi:MAG: SagB/ThcOx family dehydrogenase [Candidatus Aminicenantes bacterium]|nr:SagB/ThcOx family dehydrogenase [Candidatus Aminicenantes bacterium]